MYFVNQFSAEGCVSAATSINIEIDDCFIVNAPTAFTPGDGDNTNDRWVIDQLNVRYPNNHVTIFNRWGSILFESDGYNDPWDGTYKGKVLPVGSYYYIIEFNDEAGTPAEKGIVTIIRN
jgi:gliding motility-associated-like protein